MGVAVRRGQRVRWRARGMGWRPARRDKFTERSRSPIWLGAIAIVCGGIGVAAGTSPKLGVELTIGLAFVVVVVSNLMAGMVLFTILSFLEVVNSGGAALSFMKVAGLVVFVSWYAAAATRNEAESRSLASRQPLLVLGVVGFVSWSVISLAWAGSRSGVISGTERYLLNSMLLPIVFGAVRRRRDFVWLASAFLVGADVSVIFGFLQSGGGRLSGSIGDPNELAAVLIAALMLSMPLIATAPPGSARRVWAVIGAGISLVGLLYTDSRGGLVALAITLLAGVVIGGRWRWRVLTLLVVGAGAFGVYYGVIAQLQARQHLAATDSTGRSSLWSVGLKMFAANPVSGVGTGNFQAAAIRYVQQARSLTRADLIVDDPHATHDTYLEIADELGIPGLALWLLIAVASMGAAMAAARRYEAAGDVNFELMSRALVLAILGMLVADVFISDEYSKQLWLLLALPPALLALAPRRRA